MDPKDILATCDRVRDSTLVDLGVRLEDKADGEQREAAQAAARGRSSALDGLSSPTGPTPPLPSPVLLLPLQARRCGSWTTPL